MSWPFRGRGAVHSNKDSRAWGVPCNGGRRILPGRSKVYPLHESMGGEIHPLDVQWIPQTVPKGAHHVSVAFGDPGLNREYEPTPLR